MKPVLSLFAIVVFINARHIKAEGLLRGGHAGKTLVGGDENIQETELLDCEQFNTEGGVSTTTTPYKVHLPKPGEDGYIATEKKKILCNAANSMIDTVNAKDKEEDVPLDGNSGNEKGKEEESKETKKEGILHVSHEMVQDKLHFVIMTKGSRDGKTNCGGCKALWDLRDEIDKLGVSVITREDFEHGCPSDEDLAEPLREGKTIVFVFPETSKPGCNGAGSRVQVRWILAPLGALVEMDRWKSWGQNDLVFSFSNIVAGKPDLPVTNILQLLDSPVPGDSSDVTEEQFFNKVGRSDIMWMLRKAAPYKDSLDYIHHGHGMSYWQNEKPKVPDDFLRHEYFISYDPYTYFTFMAAMVGTVSIVNPVQGFDKHQWLRGTYVGEYMAASGKPVPGVAYGWNEQEINYARATMPKLRDYMYKVRAWGREESIPRFMRDCYRYAHGDVYDGETYNSDKLEGGLLVSESFGDNLRGPLQLYMDTHEHDGVGHQGVVEDNDVTDDGLLESDTDGDLFEDGDSGSIDGDDGFSG